MHILGLACGSPNGNSEILLTAALQAAEQSVSNITVSMIRITDLHMPSHMMGNTFDPSRGSANAIKSHPQTFDEIPDDRPQLLEAILQADALILSSPIYSRQPPGILKHFCDKAMGPFVDVAHVKHMIRAKAAGDPRFADLNPDMRVLKPRVAGLIAVGGASSPEWVTFGLPLLHQCVFSLHAKVVDQLQVLGQPLPGTVLLRDNGEDWVSRAELLGKRVASQMGLAYDDAKYLGYDGICPHCHLDMILLHKTMGHAADCAVCGARGRLIFDQGGKYVFELDEQVCTSILTMEGKEAHLREIERLGKSFGPRMAAVQAERTAFRDIGERLRTENRK